MSSNNGIMSEIAIEVENVSKLYRIGAVRNRSIRDLFTGGFDLFSKKNKASEEFWALRDLSFQIRKGEAVGIMGKNGAGKSTLLKVLSRITEPTKGRIVLNGKVSSLLEVGTGFHPELSGRENIFLNGTILGMKRSEIKKKFDEIVSFSGIEKFIDTPVKRYSSGMYVRLAFAVAANLDPEILIIDEVLAVGDSEFQKKCLGKMNEVAGGGRTVLFVSHNMEAVTRLCKSAILLKNGKVECQGETVKVVNHYLRSDFGTSALRKWEDLRVAPGNDVVRLTEVKVISEDERVQESIDIRKPVGIRFTYEVMEPGHMLVPGLNLHNDMGVHILSSHDTSKHRKSLDKGSHTSTVWVPGNFLAEGNIFVSIAIMKYDPFEILMYESEAVAFNVVDTMEGDSARGLYGGSFPGAVRPILNWSFN